MRFADILLSFPAILLGLALAAVVGPGLTAIVIALSIATIPDVARITRSAAIVVMGQDYMEAGRAVGLPDRTLIWRYLALNCLSSVFVFLTLRFGQIILIGAALSFLGLGVRPPEAELGMMASLGRDALFFAPHISMLPSLDHRADRALRQCAGRRPARRARSAPAQHLTASDPTSQQKGRTSVKHLTSMAAGALLGLAALPGAGPRAGLQRLADHRPRGRHRPLRPAALDGARRLRGHLHDGRDRRRRPVLQRCPQNSHCHQLRHPGEINHE